MKLSIFMPGIRREQWAAAHDSIGRSFSESWELCICGPYAPEKELLERGNVTFVEDWGSAARAQQLALLACKGEYVARLDDDTIFFPGIIDKAFALGPGPKRGIACKCTEGDDINAIMLTDAYYSKKTHEHFRNLHMPDHYVLSSSTVFLLRDDVLAVGGHDCAFEATPLSSTDMIIRLQNNGVTIAIQPELGMHGSWTPGTTGDHAPMHHAFFDHDEPYFRQLYGSPDCLNRICVPVDNWKNSPPRWNRRFGPG